MEFLSNICKGIEATKAVGADFGSMSLAVFQRERQLASQVAGVDLARSDDAAYVRIHTSGEPTGFLVAPAPTNGTLCVPAPADVTTCDAVSVLPDGSVIAELETPERHPGPCKHARMLYESDGHGPLQPRHYTGFTAQHSFHVLPSGELLSNIERDLDYPVLHCRSSRTEPFRRLNRDGYTWATRFGALPDGSVLVGLERPLADNEENFVGLPGATFRYSGDGRLDPFGSPEMGTCTNAVAVPGGSFAGIFYDYEYDERRPQGHQLYLSDDLNRFVRIQPEGTENCEAIKLLRDGSLAVTYSALNNRNNILQFRINPGEKPHLWGPPSHPYALHSAITCDGTLICNFSRDGDGGTPFRCNADGTFTPWSPHGGICRCLHALGNGDVVGEFVAEGSTRVDVYLGRTTSGTWHRLSTGLVSWVFRVGDVVYWRENDREQYCCSIYSDTKMYRLSVKDESVAWAHIDATCSTASLLLFRYNAPMRLVTFDLA